MQHPEQIEVKRKIEVEFWQNSEDESPESDSLANIINKFTDADVLMGCVQRHKSLLPSAGRCLELGGGQGWASCLLKRLHPECHITMTDISEYAVASKFKWEYQYQVKLDNSYSCTSNNINEPDNSLDFIFCFAAAHHFLAHRSTLKEISRVLKPGGRAIYFYEPTTPAILYRLAYWRVNKKRPEVPEDVLVPSKLRTLAKESELTLDVDYYPSLRKRGVAEFAYYAVLNLMPFLQRAVPCTANLIFTKT